MALHRVAECPDCKENNWAGIRLDIQNALDQVLLHNTITPEEYANSYKFFEECSDDELATILHIIESAQQAALIQIVNNAAESATKTVLSFFDAKGVIND